MKRGEIVQRGWNEGFKRPITRGIQKSKSNKRKFKKDMKKG
jgi:hypothetical protein